MRQPHGLPGAASWPSSSSSVVSTAIASEGGLDDGRCAWRGCVHMHAPHIHCHMHWHCCARVLAVCVARRVRLRLRDGCEKHHLHKHDVEEVAGRVLVLERCETDVRAVSHAAG